MFARDLMTQPAITCHVNDPLTIAAQRMWDHDIGALAVVNDEGKLTGMLTDRDICMAAYTQGRPLGEVLVNTAMAQQVVSASPDAVLTQIEELMALSQVRRIPIVDPDHRPVGVVALNDLARECDRPRSQLKHGPVRVAHTLAAIGAHRASDQRAA